VSPPSWLEGPAHLFGQIYPLYRLAVVALSIALAVALWLLLEKTRLGIMIRASVDDMQMARGIGIPASRLFTIVFCLGSALAGIGGVVAAPILSVYPGLDADMLPLALVVVILGGLGSLGGAFVGSFLIGFIYTFGQVLFPDLAYIILFLPMVIILAVRPRGLFGRISA
jgi:branched-chain amino acid transport system permease protein